MMKNLIAVGCAIVLIVAGARAEDMRTIDGQVFVRTKGAETIKLSLVDVLLFDEKAITQKLETKRDAAKPIYEALQPILKVAESRKSDAKEAMDRAFNVEKSLRTDEASAAAIIPYVKEGTELWRTLSRIKETVHATHLSTGTQLSSTAMNQVKTAVAEAVKTTSEAFRETSREVSDILGKMGYTSSALYYFSDLPKAMQATKTDADGKFGFKVPSGSYVLVADSSRQAGKETEFYHWMVKINVDTDKKIMLANDNLSTSGSPDSMVSTTEIGTSMAEGVSLASLEAFIEMKKAEQLAEVRERAAAEAAKQEAARQAQVAQAAKNEKERQEQLESFRKDPKAAHRKAIELYPDVGVAGSPLNKEFVTRVKRYQIEKKDFFAEPDWPLRLAIECSKDLSAKEQAK